MRRRLPHHAPTAARRGAVRRRPAVVAAVAGTGALVIAAALISQSVLAAGLTAAHEDTRIYLDGLSGTGVGLAATTADHATGPADATPASRARVGLHLQDVRMSGLCLVAAHDVPGLGRTSMVITAGEPVDGQITGEDPVRFDTLTLDVASLTGDAHDVEGLALGRTAQAVPGGMGAVGEFGISVDGIRFDDLALSSGALDLSSGATLPGLAVRTVSGTADRTDCT